MKHHTKEEYLKFFEHMEEEDKKVFLVVWLGMKLVGGYIMLFMKIIFLL